MIAKKDNRKFKKEASAEQDFEQKIIDLARVTRVMKGGKRMRFRACMALGDKKGRVAVAVAKGADVTIAISKAVNRARKNFVRIPIVGDNTIPHETRAKFKAAKVMIKPAPKGTGVKAGGVMRTIFELAGIDNVVGKILGSKNKINIVQATLKGLLNLKTKSIIKKNGLEQKETSKNEELIIKDIDKNSNKK